MPERPPRRSLSVPLALCAALAGVAASSPAQAPLPPAMQLTRLDCAHGSRLVVQDAPRAEVLRGLAQAWRFRLDLDQAVPGTLRLDAEGPPDKLLQRVLHPHSFLLLRRPDTRCPGQLEIARVVVIAGSGSAAAPPRLPSPPRAPALAPHAYTEQADTLTQSYLHSHGAPRPAP